MGTLLYARGVSLDACFDVLNLNNPRVVQSIHADYIAAGADCIETNTFGANRFKLAVHGMDGRVREINRQGVALARDVRESSGRDVLVLGSIGPLGKYLAPLGTVTTEEAQAAFLEQADIATALGARIWDTSRFVTDDSIFGRVLHTLFGYTDRPTELQFVVYVATLAIIFGLMRAFAPTRTSPRPRLAPGE